MGSTHAQLKIFADLPADAVAALDAWDPDRRALVLASPYFTGAEIGGRPVVGGRRPEWATLEDKTIADALWDDSGVPRATARVVATSYDVLTAAVRDVDKGPGTVWSGDAREGFNGAGEYVRGCVTTSRRTPRATSSPCTATGCASCRSSTACPARSTGSSHRGVLASAPPGDHEGSAGF